MSTAVFRFDLSIESLYFIYLPGVGESSWLLVQTRVSEKSDNDSTLWELFWCIFNSYTTFDSVDSIDLINNY